MTLVKGANAVLLPSDDLATTSVGVELKWSASDTELNICGFVVGSDTKVLSDEHFVFFNNPSSPDDAVSILEQPPSGTGGRAQIVVSLEDLPAEAKKVVVALAAMEDDATLASLEGLTISIFSLQTNADLAEVVVSENFSAESLVTVVELYRHNATWKVRAVLQGYANGLAGIAKDLGVEVE